jgi:hypothetical protein
MNTHDHSRKAFLLLAVGAFVTLLVGGVAGYGNKHSAFPWEARPMDTTKNELSLDVRAQELKKSPDIDKKDWPNLGLPLVSSYETKILQPDQEFKLRSNR